MFKEIGGDKHKSPTKQNQNKQRINISWVEKKFDALVEGLNSLFDRMIDVSRINTATDRQLNYQKT